MDADQIRNARRVLANLGLPESVPGVPELGWVEREALVAEEERAEEAERLEEELIPTPVDMPQELDLAS